MSVEVKESKNKLLIFYYIFSSISIMDYAVNLGLAKLDAYGSLVIRKKLMIQPRYCKYPMKIDREMKGTISHVR